MTESELTEVLDFTARLETRLDRRTNGAETTRLGLELELPDLEAISGWLVGKLRDKLKPLEYLRIIAAIRAADPGGGPHVAVVAFEAIGTGMDLKARFEAERQLLAVVDDPNIAEKHVGPGEIRALLPSEGQPLMTETIQKLIGTSPPVDWDRQSADWKWFFQQMDDVRTAEDWSGKYAGQFVVVLDKELIGSGHDSLGMRATYSRELKVHPEQFVIQAIDGPDTLCEF